MTRSSQHAEAAPTCTYSYLKRSCRLDLSVDHIPSVLLPRQDGCKSLQLGLLATFLLKRPNTCDVTFCFRKVWPFSPEVLKREAIARLNGPRPLKPKLFLHQPTSSVVFILCGLKHAVTDGHHLVAFVECERLCAHRANRSYH